MNDKVKANEYGEPDRVYIEPTDQEFHVTDVLGGTEYIRADLINATSSSQWISREERLPTKADEDCKGDVWVWTERGYVMSVHWDDAIYDYTYTHWMPTGLTIPAPPNEEETE